MVLIIGFVDPWIDSCVLVSEANSQVQAHSLC